MPEYYAPGVHIEKESRGERYLEIVKTDCAVFFGITERGPIGKPLRISSFSDFKNAFGSFLPGSFLPYAVYGFFLNGGRECFVVRIAHIYQREREEINLPAGGKIPSRTGKPLYDLEASSGGAWGNRVILELKPARTKIKTYPLTAMNSASATVQLANARRFAKGDVVIVRCGEDRDQFEIEDVKGAHIIFKPGALKNEYDMGEETEIAPVRYDLMIRCGEQREHFKDLSPGLNSKRYIIDYLSGNSRLVRISAVDERKIHLPGPGRYTLLGGKDGLSTIIPDDYIGLSNSPGERVGMALLDELDEGRIIVLPDLYTHQEIRSFGGAQGVKTVLRAAIDYVENSRYRFLLIDPPPGHDIKAVLDWREDYDSSYVALTYPWLKAKIYQSEEMLPVRLVPPSGHVAGLMAASDVAHGTHHSFANQEIEGIVDTEFPLTQFDTEVLNPEGINATLAFPGRGIRIWGARTLASDAAFRYINVRRTFNMISESIEQGTQWVTFEPNSHELWENVKRLVFFFLKGLWKKGFLQGENVAEAFYIKVDEENNPADVRDRGELIIEVGVAIVRPAEFIIVRVSQKTMETQEE